MSFDGDLYPEAGASKVITSKGDLVRGNASGDRERYGIGSTGNVLTVASGTVAWQAPAGGGAWTERANVTLTSAASDIDSGTFTTDNIIMWSAFIKPVTTTGNIEMRLNGDSAASYCNRGQTNNGTSFSATAQNSARIHDDAGTEHEFYIQGFIYNKAASEKIIMEQSCQNTASGTSATLTQCLIVNKWVNTSAQCNQITVLPATNTLDTGSNLTIWTAS